jgi:hypothetical protein
MLSGGVLYAADVSETILVSAALAVDKNASFEVAGHADLIEQMESARRVIELKFLSAGEVLSEAVEGIGGLITALDDLTRALDPAAITATVQDLHDAAGKLTALPARHGEQRNIVSELDQYRGGLGASLSDMRQSLAYMRAFTMNIKITAGGIVEADAEFGIFAQEMSSRIEAGRAEVDGLHRELEALKKPIADVASQGATLTDRCGELIPLVPNELLASAEVIREHHNRIAAATATSADLARNIRKKVGRILAALQIGDITRQRIEHVQSGLRLIDRTDHGFSADQGARARALIERLMAEQLDDTMKDFDREVSEIVASMSGLAADARALLKLRDLAYGEGGDSQNGFLRTLARRLEQATALVGEIETSEREVLKTGHASGDAVQVLASRLAAIQVMKADVQYMALNTTLKSCRIGEAGRPLSTIAVELRAHAGYLEQIANQSLVTLNKLRAAADALVQARPGQEGYTCAAEQATAALAAAGRRISDASDRTETDILRLAERGASVLDLLTRSIGRFGFQEEIGEALDLVAVDLANLAIDAAPCSEDIESGLGGILTKLSANYTMAQERAVQEAFAQTWNISPPIETSAPAAAAAAEPVEMDDVLF